MTLIDKLKRLKEFEEKRDWSWYKEHWVISIEELYDKITTEWLKSYIDEGLVYFERIAVLHSDPFIGEYSTHILDLHFVANRTIRLVPVTGVTTEYDGKLDFYMLGEITDRIGIVRECKWNGKETTEWKIVLSHLKTDVKPFNKHQFEKAIEKWLP